MPTPTSESELRNAVKSVLAEILDEDPQFLKEMIEDALEDIGMAQAIREGLRTAVVDEEEVARALDPAS